MFNYEKEREKLNKIINNIPDDKRKLVEGLIADASFMAEELEKLRKYVSQNGWSETYKNGANQFGKKMSIEGDTYLKMQKNYTAIIRQLSDFLPNANDYIVSKSGDALRSFIQGGKPE